MGLVRPNLHWFLCYVIVLARHDVQWCKKVEHATKIHASCFLGKYDSATYIVGVDVICLSVTIAHCNSTLSYIFASFPWKCQSKVFFKILAENLFFIHTNMFFLLNTVELFDESKISHQQAYALQFSDVDSFPQHFPFHWVDVDELFQDLDFDMKKLGYFPLGPPDYRGYIVIKLIGWLYVVS